MPFHSIFTCGHGAGGRLGLNDDAPRSRFVGPLGTLEGVVVESVICGSKHTLLLSRDGDVSCSQRQICLAKTLEENLTSSRTDANRPGVCVGIQPVRTDRARTECSSRLGAKNHQGTLRAQSRSGEDIYCLRMKRRIADEDLLLCEQVAAGEDHSLAVTETGEVFS